MLSVVIIFAASRGALACSCQGPDRASAFSNADEVVGGEVVGTKSDGAHSVSVFQVGKRWKGGNANTLLLRTDGPCGFTLERGRTYLVFARAVADGSLHVSQCSGSQLFGKNQALVRQLDMLQP